MPSRGTEGDMSSPVLLGKMVGDSFSMRTEQRSQWQRLHGICGLVNHQRGSIRTANLVHFFETRSEFVYTYLLIFSRTINLLLKSKDTVTLG